MTFRILLGKDHFDSSPCGATVDGDGTDRACPFDAAIDNKGLQCEKENVSSLLWAWKGKFEKALSELDMALRWLLDGLEKIGPSLKPDGHKKGAGFRAFRLSPMPKSKLKPNSKGPVVGIGSSAVASSSSSIFGTPVEAPVADLISATRLVGLVPMSFGVAGDLLLFQSWTESSSVSNQFLPKVKASSQIPLRSATMARSPDGGALLPRPLSSRVPILVVKEVVPTRPSQPSALTNSLGLA